MKKTIIYFLILLFLNLVSGCQTYKASSKTEISVKKLTSLTQKDKYFIIHEQDSTWQLFKPVVLQSDLIGLKLELDDWYKNKGSSYLSQKIKYNKKDTLKAQVVKEVHIYTTSVVQIDGIRVSIPIESMQLIQYYKPQQAKVVLIVLGSIIVPVTLFLVLINTGVFGI